MFISFDAVFTRFFQVTNFAALIVFAGVIPAFASEENDREQRATHNSENPFFSSRFNSQEQDKIDINELSECVAASARSSIRRTTDFSGSKTDKQQRTISYDGAPEIGPQRTHLKGRVKVRYVGSQISADEIILEHESERLSATGGVTLESDEALFLAESLQQDNRQNKLELQTTQFYLFANNANGTAKKVTVTADQETRLDELTFSTCQAEQKSWQLTASEMQLNAESGRGEAWNTTLEIGDVPIFYFPYLNFPIDERRQSGLLSPAVKNSDKSGLDLTLPYYWNIAPSLDATFTPRQMEKRGLQLGTEFRWLTEKSYTEVYGEWIEKDKLVEQTLTTTDPLTNDPNGANSAQRWLGRLSHQTVFSSNLNFNVESYRVSDSDYFRDYSVGLEESNETQLSSRASLKYSDPVWDINLFAVSYQALIGTESYQYLPSLDIQADYLSAAGLRWQLESEWSRFEHRQLNQLEGSRTSLAPAVSYPVERDWGYFTPKMAYQMTRYRQQSQLDGQETEIDRDLPVFSLDSALYFDRQTRWFGSDYSETLSPRVFYSYIPYRQQSQINLFDTTLPSFEFNQLWRENRFSGIDRIGDANQLSVALANSLVQNNSGEKVFDFSLGRRIYFERRRVQLDGETLVDESASPWLAQLSFRLHQSTEFDGFIEWDQKQNNTNQARARIKFEPQANHIVNLSHRYRNTLGRVSEEADISFAWPVNDRWRLVGRWYNDLRRGQTVESLAGVEYESCCWAIRLVAQKYLNIQLNSQGLPAQIGGNEYSDGIYLQFVFKGLGSAGQAGLSELLESSIQGYRDPFLTR